MVGELGLGGLLAGPRHDPGDDALAQILIGLARDRDLGDAGMLEQGGLDLSGADLVSARLDQVRRPPPDDADVPVRSTRGEVAGREPPVARRRPPSRRGG